MNALRHAVQRWITSKVWFGEFRHDALVFVYLMAAGVAIVITLSQIF